MKAQFYLIIQINYIFPLAFLKLIRYSFICEGNNFSKRITPRKTNTKQEEQIK